jgi:hypothetical protein
MSLDRWRYELRILGWWAFLLPVLVMLCLIPLTLLFRDLHVEDLRIAQVLTASLEMLLPVAAGLVVTNLVGYDASLELHLTFPANYRLTAATRTALVVLWTTAIALISSAFLFHLKELRIPTQIQDMAVLPQFASVQLAWFSPLCWFVALGVCCSLLIHSRSASSALLSGIWTLEAVFSGYFALLDGLKPLFLFPTTLDPQITFWLLNRAELLGTALLLGVFDWFLLHNTEALLRGTAGGE